MFKEKENVIKNAMLLFDALIVSLAFFPSYFIWQKYYTFYKGSFMLSIEAIEPPLSSIGVYIVVLFFVVPLWCILLYLNGAYYDWRTRNLLEILWIVTKSAFFTILASGTIIYLFRLEFVNRLFFVIFLMISSILIIVGKIVIFSFMHAIRRKGYNFRRILIVGTGRRAVNIINKIQNHPEWGIKIIGAIDDEPSRGIEKVKDVEVIGSIKDISEILHMYVIDEVIFVVPRLRLNYIENAIYDCETQGVKATVAVDLFNLKIARARQTELEDIPLLTFETTVAKESQLFIKRAMDIVISGLAIIILSPLFLVVASLIKLTSSGPVIFRQKRISLNGRVFVLYKFRTMHKEAEKEQSELKVLNEMKGPVFKVKKDHRITPVGRILRKFSIDELLQFFNIFVGHMSLIGPRPLPVYEVAKFEPWQRRRLSMRPGLTCLWQIKGRNKIEFDEWMNLDLEYLDNWSLGLDFKILILTIPVVLLGIGAY